MSADESDIYYVTNNSSHTDNKVLASSGDLFIATGDEDENGVITGTITWDYVPAGNDTDTTYSLETESSNAKAIINLINDVKAGTGGDRDTLEIVGDNSHINVSSTTDNKITVSHKTSGVTAANDLGKNATTQLADNGTFKVPTFSVDAEGHITAATEITLTLPKDDNTLFNLQPDADNNAIELQNDAGTAQGIITFKDDSDFIDVVVTDVNGYNSSVKVSHIEKERKDTAEEDKQLTYGGDVEVVVAIADDKGHVTGVTTQKIILPSSEAELMLDEVLETT
jgi:hypothetical protein